ncbi:MAG: aminoacyl-tRNA hydrolase [Acidobacteria bacterium]|nr:aminoacyl-tRNA hydrolase [Acidobacteriota bacterium]
MKLVVGLGNPGLRYAHTPHNAGFAVVDRLASAGGGRWRSDPGLSLVATVGLSGSSLLLAKPQTYVNLSGSAVSLLLSGHRLSLDDLIVICDDLALPAGRIRIRARGGDGGHNGLRSIIEALGTREFTRIRLGVAPGWDVSDAADFVLSPVPPDRAAAFGQMIHKGAEALESICLAGVDEAMNRFNPGEG